MKKFKWEDVTCEVDESICGYCGMKLDDPVHNKDLCAKEAEECLKELEKQELAD